jgi:hypothetical protein
MTLEAFLWFCGGALWGIVFGAWVTARYYRGWLVDVGERLRYLRDAEAAIRAQQQAHAADVIRVGKPLSSPACTAAPTTQTARWPRWQD